MGNIVMTHTLPIPPPPPPFPSSPQPPFQPCERGNYMHRIYQIQSEEVTTANCTSRTMWPNSTVKIFQWKVNTTHHPDVPISLATLQCQLNTVNIFTIWIMNHVYKRNDYITARGSATPNPIPQQTHVFV